MKSYAEQERYTRKREVSTKNEKTLKQSKIKLGNLLNCVYQDNIHKKMWTWHIIFKTNIQM